MEIDQTDQINTLDEGFSSFIKNVTSELLAQNAVIRTILKNFDKENISAMQIEALRITEDCFYSDAVQSRVKSLLEIDASVDSALSSRSIPTRQ